MACLGVCRKIDVLAACAPPVADTAVARMGALHAFLQKNECVIAAVSISKTRPRYTTGCALRSRTSLEQTPQGKETPGRLKPRACPIAAHGSHATSQKG